MTQPPQQPIQFQIQPSPPGNGLGIASMVLGIIALCVFCVPILPWLLAVVAIILGIISIAQSGGAPTGKAKAGMLLGCIALVAGIGFWVLFSYGAHKAGTQLQQEIEKQQKDAQNNPELQQNLNDFKSQFKDALKKSQEQIQKAKEQQQQQQNNPSQPTATTLTHPDGWSVYVA